MCYVSTFQTYKTSNDGYWRTCRLGDSMQEKKNKGPKEGRGIRDKKEKGMRVNY